MIKVENVEVWGFEHALRGMRNPLNSWNNADSGLDENGVYVIGENDKSLMKRLFNAGTEHRKYLRQIMISMDITAPFYWWKEFDTYKVGTVANSCSTMHKIQSKEFTFDDFSFEHLNDSELVGIDGCAEGKTAKDILGMTIDMLNYYRAAFNEDGKSKDDWWQMIQLLPTSYNQTRTVTMNYENAASMIKQRTGHKLDEWNEFVKVLKALPNMDIFE